MLNKKFKTEKEELSLADRSQVVNLSNYTSFSKCLVETGSSSGAGIFRAIEAGYDDIRSVELSESWHQHCRTIFSADPRVKLYVGDSRDMLLQMLPDEKCVIVLDAHPSGPHTAGHDDLMEKGESSMYHQDRILSDELRIIIDHKIRNLIIIDDQEDVKEEWTMMLKDYDFELINGKYLVCVPTEDNQ